MRIPRVGSFLSRVRTVFWRSDDGMVRVGGAALHEHYQATFGTPSGRIVLHDLIHATGFMKVRTGWPTERLLEANGADNVLRRIFQECRVTPEDLQPLAGREVENVTQ